MTSQKGDAQTLVKEVGRSLAVGLDKNLKMSFTSILIAITFNFYVTQIR